MRILDSELEARGYRRSGLVRPAIAPLQFLGRQGQGLFEVEISLHIEGWVTYIHVLDNEFKKAGKTENDESFAKRMRSSYNCLRKPIDLMKRGVLAHVDETLYHVDPQTGLPGRPYEHDFPWKHRVPLALIEGRTIVLWAKSHPTRQAMLDEEDSMNTRYRGEWAKEGWSKQRSSDGRLLRIRFSAEE
jgi:hypothetical protein